MKATGGLCVSLKKGQQIEVHHLGEVLTITLVRAASLSRLRLTGPKSFKVNREGFEETKIEKETP
jgi:hypothetical protein